ncbi:MAG: sigma-70 family RNA polymerase sigma factor [Alloprevotella sp.]|nr:sigma-70 family RNA polymerase sigma factor [Alloprevotella sp.]
MNAPSIETAISAARAGREEGFRQLFAAHSAAVFALVQHFVPDVAEAEELTQDTFLRAFAALEQFDSSRGSFLAWLRRIAYNLAIDQLRQNRPKEISLEGMAERKEEAGILDPEDFADETQERVEALMQAVGLLPAEEQTLLTLYYFDNLPQEEIAYIVGATANAVANRLRRIRKKLHNQLDNKNA